MKLVLAQYLASLKERHELDVIMPDLLSEIGLNVISRPTRGTRQYGVDVAAVGILPGSVRSLYLLSIKPGNLGRVGWDTGEQALRPSLNEIRDVYIEKHIPKSYKDLPVVVVLCLARLPQLSHEFDDFWSFDSRSSLISLSPIFVTPL